MPKPTILEYPPRSELYKRIEHLFRESISYRPSLYYPDHFHWRNAFNNLAKELERPDIWCAVSANRLMTSKGIGKAVEFQGYIECNAEAIEKFFLQFKE